MHMFSGCAGDGKLTVSTRLLAPPRKLAIINMMRFYAPPITEVTPQVTMTLRSERAMVRIRKKYRGVTYLCSTSLSTASGAEKQLLVFVGL